MVDLYEIQIRTTCLLLQPLRLGADSLICLYFDSHRPKLGGFLFLSIAYICQDFSEDL